MIAGQSLVLSAFLSLAILFICLIFPTGKHKSTDNWNWINKQTRLKLSSLTARPTLTTGESHTEWERVCVWERESTPALIAIKLEHLRKSALLPLLQTQTNPHPVTQAVGTIIAFDPY